MMKVWNMPEIKDLGVEETATEMDIVTLPNILDDSSSEDSSGHDEDSDSCSKHCLRNN